MTHFLRQTTNKSNQYQEASYILHIRLLLSVLKGLVLESERSIFDALKFYEHSKYLAPNTKTVLNMKAIFPIWWGPVESIISTLLTHQINGT